MTRRSNRSGYNIFNNNLVQEECTDCNREFEMIHLGYQRKYKFCNPESGVKENYSKIGLGVQNALSTQSSALMGIPIGCGGMTSCCDMSIKNPQEEEPLNYRFTSNQYLKFLDCMPANTRLSVEDPDNPLTFIVGNPCNPNCRK